MKRFLLAAVVLLAGCGSIAPAGHGYVTPGPVITQPAPPAAIPPTPALRMVHDPGHVTGTLTGPCHLRDNGQLPDAHCTPGAYDPQITAAQLCSPTYRTSTYRAPEGQIETLKRHVLEPAYGLADVPGTMVVDHDVSLSIGGANDASNLWLQPLASSRAKDKVEAALHDAVCTGMVTLQAAQQAEANNWMTAEQALGIKGGTP